MHPIVYRPLTQMAALQTKISFGDSQQPEDMSNIPKRQLVEYIVSVQATPGTSLECPFGVRCTTAGE